MINNTVKNVTNPAPQEHVADLTAPDPLFGGIETGSTGDGRNRTIDMAETAELPDPLSIPTALETAMEDVLQNQRIQPGEAQDGAQPPQPDQSPQEETEERTEATIPPELEKQYGALDDYLQARFGIDLATAFSAISQLTEFRNESLVERQQRELQSDWGVDSGEMGRRMELIRNEFKQLTPEQQLAMDNPQGAKILWDAIEARQLRQQTTSNRPRPVFNRTQQRQPQNYDFKQSEIMAMIASGDYDKNADRIVRAYQNKRVLMDIQM